MRPGIVHRIDMDTTGSLLICKNDAAHQILAEELKEHSITRRYHAIVHGNLKEDEGTVDAPIGRHPVDRKKMSTKSIHGRRAVTHYKVLERFGNYTYIECELETGRTHQIAFIWQVSGIRFWEIRSTDLQNAPSGCRDRRSTQRFWIQASFHSDYMEFDTPLQSISEAPETAAGNRPDIKLL